MTRRPSKAAPVRYGEAPSWVVSGFRGLLWASGGALLMWMGAALAVAFNLCGCQP